MDENGEILRQERFPNSLEVVMSFFSDVGGGKVALEASQFWEPIYDELEEMGFEVKLAHPRKTRMIADEKTKTDLRASEAMAQLLRTGWLPEAYVPPADIRGFRERRKISIFSFLPSLLLETRETRVSEHYRWEGYGILRHF